MSPDDQAAFWADVEAAFSAAVDLDPSQRRAMLDSQWADRPRVRAEVESLLAAHVRASHFMLHPTMAADAPAGVGLVAGDIVGQFRLVEIVAAGGMATVYKAERADRAFEQRVAVKVISAPVAHEDVRRRFLAERQILASLHHPNIVTLLDAGLTGDGRAYLIMEFVDGTPITTYCRARSLPINARLRLFQQVCHAVQHAHAHLVVHRDLKPENVLVTEDGVPKVLDFGISSLLDGPSVDAPGESAGDIGLEPLTPNYASPEQLRGERVTAASDVYALGLLLYELTAGTRPYNIAGKRREDAIRIVNETPTIRPSEADPPPDARPAYDWRRALRGDLDAITLRACHRTPADRYASADAFAQDIGRHLRSAPVEARKPTFLYIAGRLAARHRIAFASAVVSSALVVAAMGVAMWQAHAARLARERADRRFNDVRALASDVIFKIHDAVAPLPGSTPVRQTIVTEGLTYLERLSADAAADEDLRLELGRAYLKIGEVQGRPNTPNLGDRVGALKSFAKAKALIGPLAQRADVPVAVFRSYLDALRFSSETLAVMGSAHRGEATDRAREAVQAAERFAATHPANEQTQAFLGSAEFALAARLDGEESMPHWKKAGAAYDALLARAPEDPVRQRNAALVEKYVGGKYEGDVDYDAALAHYRRALDLDQRRLDRDPGNRLTQFDLAIDLSNVAHCAWRLKQLPEAIALYGRSLEMRERLLATDPEDVLSQEKVAFIHEELGSLYEEQGDLARALDNFRRAGREGEAIAARSENATVHTATAWAGVARLDQRFRAASCDAWRHAFNLLRSVPEAERRRLEVDVDSLPATAQAAANCGYAPAVAWMRARPPG